MIDKKISNPLKATTLGLFIFFAYKIHQSKVDAYAKATELLSSYHQDVMDSIISNIPKIKAGLSYDDLLGKILSELDSFKEDTYTIPGLLTSFTDDLVKLLGNKFDSGVNPILSSFKEETSQIQEEVENYTDKIMEELDIKFKGIIEDLNEENLNDLNDFYSEMVETMRPRFISEISKELISNIEERHKNASEFYSVTKEGLLLTYRTFIDLAKAIGNDFILSNQGRNWVQSQIQNRIISVFSRTIKYDMFEDLISSDEVQESETRMNSIIDSNFVIATEIRDGIRDELEFRVEKGHIPGLITGRVSSIFLDRFDQVVDHKILSDKQKDVLADLTQELHDNLLDELSRSELDFTLDVMNGHSDEYLRIVLPEMANYLIAIFIEFRSVLTRSRLEGSQSTIVQFFEMRRALDYNFLFDMAEEEEFDMDKTESRFNVFFEKSLKESKDKMIGLVRMSNILFLYDDSFDFLSSLSEILFFTDDKLRVVVDEISSGFHDKLAITIGESIEMGIDDVFEEQASESKEVVLSIFADFRSNMEVQKVKNVVDQTRVIISDEIAGKVSFIVDALPDLINSFKTEATEKFTEEWFQETQKSFITEKDADFDGMRKFVVQEMNVEAESKTQKYRDLVSEYIENQVESINDVLGNIIDVVTDSVQGAPISEEEKTVSLRSLESARIDIEGSISSVKSSVGVSLNGLLQEAIRSLDEVMDLITNNFFETTRQVIVSQFQEWAQIALTDFYVERMEDVTQIRKRLANIAKSKFEEHVTNRIDVENEFRSEIKVENDFILEQWSIGIVNDFNIVSYNARRGILLNNMRNEISTKGLGTRRNRTSKLWDLNQAYEEEQRKFQNTYEEVASVKTLEFSRMYAAIIEKAYERFADVLGSISDVLSLFEGDMRDQYTYMYGEVIENIISNPFNDLPEISMTSISYPSNLLSLADSSEGDLPSLMLPHLIVELNSSLVGTEIYDSDVLSAITGDELTVLGESDSNILKPHERIILAMSDFGQWEEQVIVNAIDKVERDMDQRLKENTCSNKPCEDGSVDCANPSCRDGYILSTNSHGILCCSWSPVEAGFPFEEVGRMLAEEMALMLFASPDGAAFMLKLGRKFAKKVGTAAAKMAKSLKMLTKMRKLSGPIAKTAGKMSKKLALKTGQKVGQKIGIKLGKKLGVKVGVKVVTKVAAGIAGKLLKSAVKAGSSGPIGAALLIFDLVSLVLDLWDPAGYNNAQSAGQIQKISDDIVKQYDESLKNEGITDPFISDVMYDIDPETQGEFIENLVLDWFSDELSKFSSANEARWELMPDSEAANETDREIERLSSELDTNVNLIQELINQNTENTFMIRQSTISKTDKNIVGTDKDKDYDKLNKRHLSICSLNSTGIALSNSFAIEKADFINALKKDPLYRWVKITNGFKVYKDLTESELKLAENQIQTIENTQVKVLAIFKQEKSPEATAAVVKVGYSLERMDPEREFWKQHTYMKEVSGRFPERRDYIKAWDHDKVQKQDQYNRSIITHMEEMMVDLIPCDPLTGICESNASLEMIKNKKSDSPEWWPDYQELFDEAKKQIDENIVELLEDQRQEAIISEEIQKKIDRASDEQVVKETAELGEHSVTLKEAERQRKQRDIEARKEEVSPEFSVFKDGFGQVSPLYSVKIMCDDMEHGVRFDGARGNCIFTREYCKRYGLTYFNNEELNVPDCRLAGSQRVFEGIFGTTVTRSVKRLYVGSPETLGSIITNNQIMGETIVPYNLAMELDRKGLGSKNTIWN